MTRVQRRATELFATLGPAVSKVDEAFAATHGWTPSRSNRIWELNPAYKQHEAKFRDARQEFLKNEPRR